ncbi:receptor like protein 45 [Raphanus sativus]|nr:receptor like protein 45 [Raphanus sativus]
MSVTFQKKNYIISGFLVKELINLKNLELLDLKANGFSGHLPGKRARQSEEAQSFGSKRISYLGRWQARLCGLEQLQELQISRNNFVGEIPLCFSRFSKLRVLDLSSNSLSGKLPSFLSNFKSMEYLSLLDNNFEGLFSLDLISELTELKVFKLSSTSSTLKGSRDKCFHWPKISANESHIVELQHVQHPRFSPVSDGTACTRSLQQQAIRSLPHLAAKE